MIKPTLFVGLGTTGTKILKSLRQLMAEEYTRAGLPIFRYIAIETDGAMTADNPDSMEDYEKITVVSATIDATVPIQHKLKPEYPGYNPHLKDWLDARILGIKGFEAGAANIRMAGRLCLWENWAKIAGTLAREHRAIIAPATIDETNRILARHHAAKGLAPGAGLVGGGGINVYIVGTLCGGSCSGMLIDIAYFFRNLLGKGDGSKIYGIFTIFDKAQAALKAANVMVQAANCYGALWELNYYNYWDNQHTENSTSYNVTFPDGVKVDEPTQLPFDYTTFVSQSGKIPSNKFVLGNGDFDESGLNLMVALNLFAEAAGDTDGRKEAIRTNFTGWNGFGELRKERAGTIPVMVRRMASFGLTAVWYPKYRIASAAACLASRKLCDNWRGAHVPKATIVADAAQEWQTMLSQNLDTLTSPVGLPPLQGQIAAHLGKAQLAFGRETMTALQLQNMMQVFPQDESGAFRDKFDSGGQYFALMEMQVVECKKVFRNEIERALNNQLSKIDFQGTYGIGDVREFFQALDGKIKDTIDACPDRLPSLDLRELNFNPMHRAENNRWTKFIGLQAQSIEAHRKKLIATYCGLISGNRNSIYVRLRNYFLRPVLQEIREELGFGVQPRNTEGPNRRQTIQQRLDQIMSNLGNCVRKFDEDYESAVNAPKSECVKIVTNNPQNRIDADADELRYRIAGMDTRSALLSQQTMREFLERSSEDIASQMTETYRQLSLTEIKIDSVVTKTQEILKTGGNDIQNLASRSNPYQELKTANAALPIEPPPNIIFGHDDSTETALSTLKQSLTSPTLAWDDPGGSSVDHLLFFYQEEAGFTLADLSAYDALKQHFEASPGPYGHLTHQDPNFYDLEIHHKSEKLTRWCRALSRLVPEIRSRLNSEAFSGVFQPHSTHRYVYEYYVDGVVQSLGLSGHSGGIKMLSRRESTDAYNDFFKDVQSGFARLGREKILELINPLLRDVANLDERGKLSQFYLTFLDEVYPDGGVAPPKANDASETHFRNAGQQPYAEPAAATENPPVPPNPVSRNTAHTNASAEGYVEHSSEESEHVSGAFAEAESENVQRNPAASTGITGSSTAEDEPMWAEGEPGTESGQTSEPTEAVASEPPHESAQEKQAAPPKPFSVADVDIKRLK